MRSDNSEATHDGKATEAARDTPDWIILAIACVAQFMVVLDVSVVNVALPSIGRDLHYTPTGLQWVVNAYVLTFAGFLLLGGRAADLFGRRRVYLFGLGLFTAASLAGGLAQNSTWLTAARAVQGVGGAFLSPATLTIIVTTFTGARMAKALGVWSAVAGAGGAAGAVLGGVLTAELSWRWVLFINIPIGLVTIAAAVAYLTESKHRTAAGPPPRLDILGAVLVTGGLATLIYAIVGTNQHPWGSARTLSVLAAALVLLGAFALVEFRVASTPLVPFGLFRSRWVTGANIVMLIVGAVFFSMWYFLSLYLQNVLHYGPLRAGMAFLPMGIAVIIGAQVSSRVLTRVGVRPLLLAGTAVATAGFVGLSRIVPHGSYWEHVFGPGCLVSLAFGALFTPLAAAATTGVPYTESGLASGLLNTSRQVGGSVGLAALATVAADRTIAVLGTHNGSGAAAALTAGYSRAFEVASILGLVAFAAAFVVPRVSPGAAVQTATAQGDGPAGHLGPVETSGEGPAVDLGTV
jgi:EmrB/QacA subfamily drug resistance transporter